ncbi:heavy metal translocating P-type ATPase metal-binding domain-containing protein [bacterium SCSIO 12741]|nr:heavy metal translocating P-type ATPase metal-binding domain-containing protein [bacterium SCSIO 12741]
MNCAHCGDECPDKSLQLEDKYFCCQGCQTVYQILHENQLEDYYLMENAPGLKLKGTVNQDQFAFLDDPSMASRFIQYEDHQVTRVSFMVPQIHCSSCIWLLENLNRLQPGIQSASVNFPRRRLDVIFKNQEISLRQVMELLASIGYEPDLRNSGRTEKGKSESRSSSDKTIIYQIGIAGFCFGNIMLLAFPEYLGIDTSFESFRSFFGRIQWVLSFPVLLYSGKGYLISAWKGIRQRFINMDVPIALGMITLFLRSSYEIFTATGSGYFDSLAGLVFFLLIGKWYQQKTYQSLSFDRDFKSYFPIAVHKVKGEERIPTKIEELKPGDRIELRNQELIPADGVLLQGEAWIDYSFVTGESDLIEKNEGELLYAGGRQTSGKIQVELTREVDNSYLTQLWNQDAFKGQSGAKDLKQISDQVSRYFTVVVLGITAVTGIYWYLNDPSVMWNAITAVLIVACPCALALCVPFTLGNSMRLLGSRGLYLKNAAVIEKMARITDIVFDKTGTITLNNQMQVKYQGQPLNDTEQNAIYTLVSQSIHPLSTAIHKHLNGAQELATVKFEEIPGRGIDGRIGTDHIRMGSAEFIGVSQPEATLTSEVHLEINGEVKGCFQLKQQYRKGLKDLLSILKAHFELYLLSGDKDHQKEELRQKFGWEAMYFDQSPMNKLEFIQTLQKDQKEVMMIGDGLNDAGALKQSDVGVAISDQVHQFSPACDALFAAGNFNRLPRILEFARKNLVLIKIGFVISFLYNIVGLSFAVSGTLSPVIAALLMPISSVSIVVFATIGSNYYAPKIT